ncbi:MAG TPA: hypothetical protein PK472_12550 [Pseudomonadota bacterium]|jgi:hypothetical protein|nr:hypothetical protein [Pseudomonadota bacterium]HND09275.1 hypothetical protein [Pseudomonadota bacterium]HNF97561.1 hypothetical protein [Pseudomonadota bacterium]HNN50309.1 hypothetical protein [Pseudomonadota bacterium]
MFVFDKRLSPEQAINHKPNSKAPFGYLTKLDLAGATPTAPMIYCKDPTVAAATPGQEAAGTVNSVGLLTRVRWDLGATDAVIIEGLIPIVLKQAIVSVLYASLTDITVNFGLRVFEYDPVAAQKKYYACFDSIALIGKIQKDGERELAIELNDNDELSIQDNSFYAFSMKIVPFGLNQQILLAAKSLSPITKMWGRTNPV